MSGMKMGMENGMLWSEIGSGFEELGSTPPPPPHHHQFQGEPPVFCMHSAFSEVNVSLLLLMRVHNRVVRSRLPADFSYLSRHPALLYNEIPIPLSFILIKIKTYLYTMGSKYGTITICQHTLMMLLNIISFCLRLSCFPSLRNFDSTFSVGAFKNCECPCCVFY